MKIKAISLWKMTIRIYEDPTYTIQANRKSKSKIQSKIFTL